MVPLFLHLQRQCEVWILRCSLVQELTLPTLVANLASWRLSFHLVRKRTRALRCSLCARAAGSGPGPGLGLSAPIDSESQVRD